MATQYTSLLGLALPVTGELSGSWGDVVNTSITSLLDSAISGTTSLTTDADVTLTTTTGAANEARQAIILWNPAAGTVTRNITAPAQSKIYTVINASGGTQSIVFRGAGPTTGVTIIKGESAVVAWNGTDFIKISNTGGGGSFTNVTISGTTTLSGLTASTALALNASKEVVSVTNTGTGNNVLATSPTLVTPVLGTPTSVTLTNATGLPISTGVSGLGAGVATFLATPSSANLAAAVTDETGSGALVFATSPTLVTPALGTPSSVTLTNATGLPISTGVSGLGTGVAGALATNVGSAGAPVLFNGALGTPSSGTVTNLTGTASININGTVGATTANTGAFTTLTTSSTVTLNGGTANGVAYLNGSKVLTTGSALTFDGTTATINTGTTNTGLVVAASSSSSSQVNIGIGVLTSGRPFIGTNTDTNPLEIGTRAAAGTVFVVNSTEQMRLTSTGLGIGTSSPVSRLEVSGTTGFNWAAGGTSAALVTIGTQGTGGSLFVNTASANSSYASGLVVDGTYSNPSSVVNLKAVGVNSGGGYNSSLAFHTSFETTLAERMRLTSAGNLGIGTTSPGYKLTVAGTSGSAVVNLLETGVRSWGIRAGGTATNTFDIADFTAGVTRLTLDSSGNLGLGVTPSAWSSYKAIQVGQVGAMWANPSGTDVYWSANYYFGSGSDRYIANGLASYYRQSAGVHSWGIAPSGTAGNAISFSQVMTLSAAGGLSVGTTIDAGAGNILINASKAIYGNATSGSFYSYLELYNGSTGNTNLHNAYAGGAITFATAGTERMRLDSSGNLGIGTSSPVYKLEVRGGATESVVNFSSTGTTAYTPTAYNGNKARLFLSGGNATGATNGIEFTGGGSNENYFGVVQESGGAGAFVWQGYNGSAYAERMRLDSSGNLGIGTSSPFSNAAYNSLTVGGAKRGILTLNNASGTNVCQMFVDSADLTNLYSTTSIVLGSASGANLLTYDSSGNLGLGVTPSGWSLSGLAAMQVKNGGLYGYDLTEVGVTSNAYYGSSSWRYISSAQATRFVQVSGQHQWFTAPSGTAGNAISFTQAATLTANGNYLVGTTSENSGTSGLKVAGQFAVTASQAFTGSGTVNTSAFYVVCYSLSGTCTLTLPTPSTNTGRVLKIVTQSNQAIVSASSNVTAIANGALGTSILPATAGKWAELWCDGTYWNIISTNV